jgi:hypothetical protein
MLRRLLFAIIPCSMCLAGQAPAQTSSSTHDVCATSDPNILEMTFEEFDSGEAGWRRWGDNGCEREAAAIIAEYRDHHAGSLDPSQTAALDWHAGQLHAGAGDYGFAIERMLLVQHQTAEPAESEYVMATIAFLRSDREALVAARERMAAIPEPANFRRAADRYVATYNLPRPVWPMNIDVVDRLIACFGWSYKVAYRGCSPASVQSGNDLRQ